MRPIAFYAPLKTPDDPVPSGDRAVAQALMKALAPLGSVRLVSRLRTRDGTGEADTQDALFRAAELEVARLRAAEHPALWLTYHSYYKAPDLIGPALARHWRIPYAIVEGTRAAKRLSGPYARFAAAAEAACDAADVIFYPTDRDREALERGRPPRQELIRLRPFLDREALGRPSRRLQSGNLRLLACAMLRHGDKVASYEALAAALALVPRELWMLRIVGDGPARAQVEAAFSAFGERVAFVGALSREGVAAEMREADVFVWPGVNEAFGMVYLEAQAEGCPVLAEDRPGVRDVVRDGGWLVPAGEPAALAAAIVRLAGDPEARLAKGEQGRARVASDHLMGTARRTLENVLAPRIAGACR